MAKTVYGFKDKVIKEYLGDIDFFLEQHQIENLREAEKRTVVETQPKATKGNQSQFSKEDEKEVKRMKNQLSKIETQIDGLEKDILEMDAKLAKDYEKTASEINFFEVYQSKKKKIEELMEEWTEVEEKVENCS